MQLRTTLYSLLALSTHLTAAQDAQIPLSSDYVCEDPHYRVHMVSTSPLVIYIANFLTAHERAHLQAITFVSLSLPSHFPFPLLLLLPANHLL